MSWLSALVGLTVKTVEMTLVRAYRKLDIGSRRELPSALEQAA